MFKTLKFSAIIFVILLWVAQASFATTTWIDNVANNSPEINNGHPHYIFIYDITGSGSPQNVLLDPSNPFHPGSDIISSADLFLNFSYGNGNADSTMEIKVDGTDYLTSVVITDIDDQHQAVASAVAQLNDNGTLRLDIHRISGTFQLTDSKLTANGTDNTLTQPDPPTQPIQPSIPEPSTFFLLGAGLLGVGFVRMRIKR
ncbi:MAG TPA: PEP-CTERM sorting domain-containing protein [Candidatus Sulfobium mesophilum]|nr:PEP-CTERM sorting domain-containing protein [Candidatus Sulfobium mesophilum]